MTSAAPRTRLSPSPGLPARLLMTRVLLPVLWCVAASTAHAQVTPLGPTPYRSFADSPFQGGSFQWFILLTAEVGHTVAPGIRIINQSGADVLTTGPGGITDSVDGDDGIIDGLGSEGRSYFTCPSFIDIRFDAAILGSLPTHAGVVWTDGAGLVTVQAYSSDGGLLATVTGDTSDGNFSSGTAEDRFYGFIFPGGIARLTIGDQNNCIEVDHIQAGSTGRNCAGCSLADLPIAGVCPDGVVDGSDFIAFINSFGAGEPTIDPLADVAGGGASGLEPDGIIDGSDFVAFINAFAAGC